MQSLNLTVKQLNMYVRSLLEGDTHLASISLEGEISGFKNHFGSGHWYFTLKDADAAVKSVMFKGNTLKIGFIPKDGEKVICRGYVSLYERDGQFQFYAETMQKCGEGDLAAEFERIKRKLESEGLFDTSKKRSLPPFPKKIGIITSETGAALQDFLQITSRRYPLCDIVLFPSLVQGASASKSLIASLKKAYLKTDLDLLVIGRGGGSAEDLSCFNDEELARTVFDSPVPIISAVGHEIDFTICDFVADLRAPTPSAAAELAVPSFEELLEHISYLYSKIFVLTKKQINDHQIWLDNINSRRCFAHPDLLFEPFKLKLDTLINRFENAYYLILKNCENRLNKNVMGLEALSPIKVMERGYSVVYKNDVAVNNTDFIKTDDCLKIRFLNGEADVKVLNITTK